MSEEIVIKNQETRKLRVSIKTIGWPMENGRDDSGQVHDEVLLH